MDNLENELKDLKGFIAELKADRAATKEKEKRESWTKYVSLTVVVIAVVGSIAAQWSGAAFTGHASRSTQLASSSSAGMIYPTPQGSSFPKPRSAPTATNSTRYFSKRTSRLVS